MGLLDTHLAVIIPQIAVGFPMAIFIICGFMRSIPTELEEAAIIDGCTVFQCFFKIILPIAKSSVVTVAVVGELYRHNGEWKFNAIGSGFQGGLAALCGHYGIEVA